MVKFSGFTMGFLSEDDFRLLIVIDWSKKLIIFMKDPFEKADQELKFEWLKSIDF